MPPARPQLLRAWDALFYFLGERPHFPARVDFALLDALASRHRLDAALAEPRLTAVSPKAHLPREVWTRWTHVHAAALALSIPRHAAIKSALAALAPFPTIVLKGAAAAELLYPSPAARPMGDVDFLVRRGDLAPALERLAPLGYTRRYPGHPVLDRADFHERQLQGPRGELDLHQAFIQPARLPIDYPAVFARAVPWPALAQNAFVLAPEDAVVYQCLSAAIGEFTPTWSPQSGLLDLRQMLRAEGSLWRGLGPPLDPALVPIRAREWGAERMLFATLDLLTRAFPSLDVAPLVPALARPVRALLRATIGRRAYPPPLTDPTRVETLARKAILLRPAARVRLLANRLGKR